MTYTLNDVTVVICNWMQTRFTLGAVRNFKKFYPSIPVIVVDDGSNEAKLSDFDRAYQRPTYCKGERFDNDMEALRKGANEIGFTLIECGVHRGPGSANDYGLDAVKTPLMLTMDNDIRILEGGLIEEYLTKMTDDVFVVGTTFHETEPPSEWIDPWFSLWRKEPIKELHLSFTHLVYPVAGRPTFHIGVGAFMYAVMTVDTLHRNKLYKAVHYPPPEQIKQLCHLKKFPEEKAGDLRYDRWRDLIDG